MGTHPALVPAWVNYTLSFGASGSGIVDDHAPGAGWPAVEDDVTLQAAGETESVEVAGEAPARHAGTCRWRRTSRRPWRTTGHAAMLSGIAELSPGLTNVTPNATGVDQRRVRVRQHLSDERRRRGDNLLGSPFSLFIEDAIQEVQTLTSGISAEYGRFAGGVVNAVTRSGGNTFSGDSRVNLSDPCGAPRRRSRDLGA